MKTEAEIRVACLQTKNTQDYWQQPADGSRGTAPPAPPVWTSSLHTVREQISDVFKPAVYGTLSWQP